MNGKLRDEAMIAGMVVAWSVFYAVSKHMVDATGSPFAAGFLLRLGALVFLTVQLVADVFPNEDPAPFYYSFREGPVACLVLDGGETHTKRSTVYSGAKVYETYLQEQYEWAEKALQEPAFREAPVKVCLIHVPMIDPEGKQGFYIQRWLHKRFLPLLNEAGIDLMISADLHEFLFYEPGTMNNAFPILVNDDLRRLDFTYGDGTALIRTFNAKGEQEFEYRFQP